MITDLERSLREALHDDAQHARLVNPDRPTGPDVLSLSDAPHRARSGHRVVAVAATVALIAAASVVFFQNVRNRPPVVVTSPGPTQVFTDIPPGATVPLPPPPVDAQQIPSVVWTGTEIIVWGGIDAQGATVDDGAAFDLATGTWRVIAPAPIEDRAFAQVAWTGAEMFVWGGLHRDGTGTDDAYNQTRRADGAAYNPTTDSWRLLPDAPIDAALGWHPAWTGEEVILLGGGARNRAAAYNPATDQWRRLADPPELDPSNVSWESRPVWTGTAILMTIGVRGVGGEPAVVPWLVRYDVGTDTWHRDLEAGYAALVGVPDDEGVTRTVIGLPFEQSAPVDLLDDSGDPVGRLPDNPVDVDVFGDRVEADGTWVGGEALFRISNPEWAELGPPAGHGPEAWALNPTTQTWRMLPAVSSSASSWVAIGDLLFAWNESSSSGSGPAVLYRAPATPGG